MAFSTNTNVARFINHGHAKTGKAVIRIKILNRATFVFVEKAAGDALPWALVMLLPLYVVLSTWISYRVYSTRREISWILQGLQMLVYLALFVLIL